ncbi:PREDICTED: dyslexia-associated protein KIAA0319 homolog isoform X2 [Chinchilla lanigera]|uniref:KIAA0319 n=1 Tax=Chinchilla lanigera TaxID=34839 RepID=A0A8C2UM72_CHILA|nr:PREDICTED: dyslexia-associated protein KIAA0319 homolog isoform X2 [Chinchilla lanigera]
MGPPAGALLSLLLLLTSAGCVAQPCSEGRTYSNAIISPDLETIRIMPVPQTFSVGDCTAACCDLPSCDLAWWFEGHCHLVSCPQKESCVPKRTGPIRSYLTFVLRPPAQRPAQLLDYGEMMLSKGVPLGAWGDSPEDPHKDLPFLGRGGGLEGPADYTDDDYRGLEPGLLPTRLPSLRGDAQDSGWGAGDTNTSLGDGPSASASVGDHPASTEDSPLASVSAGDQPAPTGDGPAFAGDSASASESVGDRLGSPRDSPKASASPVDGPVASGSTEERPQDPELSPHTPQRPTLSEAAWPTASIPSPFSSAAALSTSPGQAPDKDEASQPQAPSLSSPGAQVLMPSQSPPDSLEFTPAMVEKSSILTVTEWSPGLSTPTLPTVTDSPGGSPSEHSVSPKTAQLLLVSAGDNLFLTLPHDSVELKALVVPAPPADTTYNYEWSLISHPVDYQDELKPRNTQTLHLSRLSAGVYAFKVTVSSDNAFGEGFVNVTVKPAGRDNLPPVAVVYPQAQELTLPLTLALLDGSQSTDDTEIVSYHWEEVSGPFLEEKTSADSPVLYLSHLVPGNYTFRLTVADSDGATSSTTATLIVNSAVDHPPVANAGSNQTITLPQNAITLNGNQSSDDHQIVLYEWSLGPGSESKEVAMQGAGTPYLHVSAMQEGEYTFQLMVTDSSGQQSTAEVAVIVQPEDNRPPVAVAGPDKELVFPVDSAILDGSRSSDDHGIVFYHWEHVRGPSAVQMANGDTAVATVTGLQVGTHHFRLTVKDQQGLSSMSTLTVAVKKENNSPPRAQAGGRHVLVLPNNSITLDGSRSTDDQGIASYLWIRDGQSPAAGDVIGGSDHSVALQLANLVEGVYTFRLRVTDTQGASDTGTATVEVRPDPNKGGLVELILQVGAGQLTEQQKDTLVRQLATLLGVLDSDIRVQKIQAHSDLSTAIVFYVQSGPPFKVLKAAQVARNLHRRLTEEKANFLLFKVLRIDTAGCLLTCSGHGHCDPITKRCVCAPLWMENPVQRYLWDEESNCEWSVLYVAVLASALAVLLGGIAWFCICCCKRRKRIKIRKKTKYTILDNMDEQERMELRPKYGLKHCSTEHNSSLMVSESEFDSDQDTIFSRERMEQGDAQGSMNDPVGNGTSFSYCSKDR